MNKVIRVIDLFNIIVNGEKIPPKIKVDKKHVFVWNSYGFYENSSGESLVENWLDNTNKLECEVEIIEDEEEIDIQRIEHEDVEIVQEILGKCDLWKGNEEYILKVIKENNNRIVDAILRLAKENRTIIKAVKQLDKKVNSIEQK